ncbi:MAG: 3-isopropylmalate dehydratase/homoaconitate hydratase family large subunit [Trueperaceae bacterium]
MIDLRGLTLAEKILSVKAARRLRAGDLAVVEVDQVMVVDSVAPAVMRVIDRLGGEIRHPERVTVVVDHVSPASNVEVATSQKSVREYARRHGLRLFDVGRGICHQVLIEEGLARPGTLVLGADSHSTTYGAVCAFGTGMGATDIALAATSGRTWLRVPATVRVSLQGRRPSAVGAKDVALEVVRRLGADGATYAAIEYHGAEAWPLSERMTLANMGVEAGAKCALVPPAPTSEQGSDVPEWLRVDQEAEYASVLELDLTMLTPRLAAPAQVDNVHGADEFSEIRVDQVFIGTCTNGRLDDLHVAADILRGRRVAEGTRLLIVPASSEVLQAAVDDGTMATLLAAGATFGTPGCGPCMGRHMGVLAPGEVCLSTGNRNFLGRMGSPDASVYLAGPAVAAATALNGRITVPAETLAGNETGGSGTVEPVIGHA